MDLPAIIYNSLRDAGPVGRGWLYFPVKVDFQSEGGAVKNRSAMLALAKVTLNFAGNFSREAPL